VTARVARVLVTGAGTGLGNNVIRSLRASNGRLVIVGCHHDRFELSKSSADHNYLVTRPGGRGFVASLRRVVRAQGVDLVVPATDGDVRAVSQARGRLGCRVFLPRHRVIERCQDKYAVTRFLRARGVPAPLTYPVRDLRTVTRVFDRLPRARLLWCRARSGSGSFAATSVRTAAHARAWIAYWRDLRDVPPADFTLCEYLPGRDFGCQSLWHAGRLVLAKTFERLAYFAGGNQPSGVSSVASLAKAVVEPRVVEVCAAAVRALDARTSGLYCIDLKENAAGAPCVTDVNVGRFSLTTGLYDLVGKHNMAGGYVRLALGERVDFGDPYDRVEDHYLVRDVDTLPEILHADDLFNGIEDARA
jgi:predicted ATP-grasp superfamily ATP-dependent carboligase